MLADVGAVVEAFRCGPVVYDRKQMARTRFADCRCCVECNDDVFGLVFLEVGAFFLGFFFFPGGLFLGKIGVFFSRAPLPRLVRNSVGFG